MEPSSSADDQEAAVPLRDVLKAVVRELEMIGGLGERTQAALSPLLADARGAVAQAQNLDLLVQQASGLAAFLRELERRCPATWEQSPGAAAAALPMHAQRLRLSRPLEAEVEPSTSGVAEFF